MSNTLFPTTVIGSLPRPHWIRELILDRKEGHVCRGKNAARNLIQEMIQ